MKGEIIMRLFDLLKKNPKTKKENIKNNLEQRSTQPTYIVDNYKMNGINYKNLPSKSQLIADVIMLYNHKSNPSELSENINDYVQYFVYRYKVNPIKLIKRLLSEGYLSIGLNEGNQYEFISSLKVTQLKEMLKNKNIKSSGKKESLINRVLENYSIIEISELYPNSKKLCFITDKAKQLIEENIDLVKLHQSYSNYMIEYDEYIIQKSKLINPNFENVCVKIFKERVTIQTVNKNWGLLRCTYFNLFSIYQSQDDYYEACKNLTKSIYIDLSGMTNCNSVHKLNQSCFCLAKFLIKNKSFFKEEYLNECIDIPLPFHYFDINTLKIIFNDILSENEVNILDYKSFMNKPRSNQQEYIYFDF